MSESTKSSKQKKSRQPVDVLFVIDSTGSMHKAIQAAHNKVEDIAGQLAFNHRHSDFRYGCICYRDKVADPNDKNQYFDFDEETENLSIFLQDVKAEGGGGDGPEDWVSALNDAFSLSWRDGKRLIIWLADYPAHGIRFAGRDKFPGEEAKLIPLVEKLATDGYYFTGIAIKKHASKTYQEMRQIYQDKGGKRFVIEDFDPNEDTDISITLTNTTLKSVKDILSD